MFALDGVRVLALENGISAPLCTRLLGDFGAEVVKVERPEIGDVNRHWDQAVNGYSSSHVWVDRNKQSLELDLKSDEGHEIFMELAELADVIVQNFSPGVVDRLGIGYDDIETINEDVIYVNISGYGDDGPYRDRKAYDLVMQGETGLIRMTGTPESPAKIPLSLCDISAGTYGALGTLNALYHRAVNGEGQEVNVSMFSSVLSWLGVFPHKYWHQGELPKRVGMRHHILTPYGPHLTADDEYISFACLSEEHFEIFCTEVIERPDLLEEPKFETNEKRLDNREEFEPIVEEEIKQEPRDYWIEKLQDAQLPWGDVNQIDDVVNHPQVEALDLVKEFEKNGESFKFIDNPVEMSASELRREPMPELGEHTAEILAELGYDEGVIEQLVAED